MSDSKEVKKEEPVKSEATVAKTSSVPEFRRNSKKMRPKRSKDQSKKPEDNEFDHRIIEIRRVSRMYKGGRRMRLSVFVAVGDRNGRVGLGLGKAADVKSAQIKAINKAKKHMIAVELKGNTIPHEIFNKFGASKVLLKPATPGTGIIAGSSMRIVAELAGIKDILGKILGADNTINNAYATFEALAKLRSSKL